MQPPAAAAPPAAAPPAAAPPAAEEKKTPKLWASSGPSQADLERIYAQSYGPAEEAERQQHIQFYTSLGKSPQVREAVCS